MIKWILILLFPALMQAQTVTKVAKTTSTTYGVVDIKPIDFDANKTYPLVVFCAGIASRGPGTTTSLDLLVKGEVPLNLQRAADKYKFILIAPQTADNYDAEIDFARNYAMGKYKIDTEHTGLFGFSLGAGDIVRYELQSTNANKFACMVPVAMTSQTGTWSNITGQKLATWFFHNLNDDNSGTQCRFTDSAVAQINRLNPAVPATKTIFNAYGHGGTAEAFNPDAAPVAPNGFGLTNPTLNTFEWFLSTSETNPIPPPGAVAPAGLVAAGKITMTGDIAFLDGTGSFNYKTASWAVVSVPAGVNPYGVNACAWVTCSVKLPAQGVYTFRLTVKDASGAAATKDVTVDYGVATPPPNPTPTPVKKVKYRIIVYDDGSVEVVPETTASLPPLPPASKIDKSKIKLWTEDVYDVTQARKTPENLFDGDTLTYAIKDFYNGYIIDKAGGQTQYVVLDSFITHPRIELFNGRWAYGSQVDFQFYYDFSDTNRKSPVFSALLPSNEWRWVDTASEKYSDPSRLMKITIHDGGANNFSEVKVYGTTVGPASVLRSLPPARVADPGKYFMGYNKLTIDTTYDDAGYSQRNINDMNYIHPDVNKTDGYDIWLNKFANSIELTYLPAKRNGRKSHLTGAAVREGFKYPPNFTNDSKDMARGADSTRIESWQPVRNTYYGLAAKLGNNKSASLLNYAYHNTPPGAGLGVCNEIEIGNEDDARWAGLLRFHGPLVKLMKLMAGYTGVKAADPGMKVISGAITGIDTSYLKAMYFVGKMMGLKEYPLDIIAINEYCTNAGGQHSGGTRGISPEAFNLYEKLVSAVNTCNRYFPSKPVYVTEIGYDVHDSEYGVPDIAGLTREQLKAIWGLRCFEIGAAAGVSRMYWYTQEQGGGGPFSTTGFIIPYQKPDGSYSTKPVDLYWYMTCRAKLLENYKAWCQVIRTGDTSGIWTMRYNHISNDKQVIYSLWIGSAKNASINNYSLSIPGAQTAILYTPTVGIKTGATTNLTVSNGTVWIPRIDETVRYLLVTLI